MAKEIEIINAHAGYSYNAMDEIEGLTYDDCDRSEIEASQKNKDVIARGGAVVFWQNGILNIQTKKGLRQYRGAAVEGRDAYDSFVRHLAEKALGVGPEEDDWSEEEMTPEIDEANRDAIKRKKLELEGKILASELVGREGVWRWGGNAYIRKGETCPVFGYECRIGKTYKDENGDEWSRILFKINDEWQQD